MGIMSLLTAVGLLLKTKHKIEEIAMYDQGSDRRTIEAYTEKYLRSHYPDWDREKIVYKKWSEL
jgi:hypothetical protein